MRKAEREHLNKVAELGCIVCRNEGFLDSPAEIHHIGNGATSKKSSHYESIPLCHCHHRTGGHGLAVHAGKKTWEAKFGTEKELLKQTLELIDVIP